MRNYQLGIQHTAIDYPHRLLAAVLLDGYEFRVIVMLQGAAIQWCIRKPQIAHDEDELRWCGIAAAVKILLHWRAILREIELEEGAAVIVHDWVALPTRSKALEHAVGTIRLMQDEGIEFKEFPGEDEQGHLWCPCCCSQSVGDGA